MKIKQLAAALMLALGSTLALAAPVITGTHNGNTDLLGADQAYAAVAGSHITTLSDSDVEYISADFALQIDFFSSGLIQLYNNSGEPGLAGSHTLSFDIAGLGQDISGISLLDDGQVLGGSISSSSWLSPSSFSISFTDLELADGWGPVSLQLSLASAAAVPEPATLVLAVSGLALIGALRRRGARA
jgi:PEP-CTERM motif